MIGAFILLVIMNFLFGAQFCKSCENKNYFECGIVFVGFLIFNFYVISKEV